MARIPQTAGMIGFDGGYKRAVTMVIPQRRVEEEAPITPAAVPLECSVIYRGRDRSKTAAKCGFRAFDDSPFWYKQIDVGGNGSCDITPDNDPAGPGCNTVTQSYSGGWRQRSEFPSCGIQCISQYGTGTFGYTEPDGTPHFVTQPIVCDGMPGITCAFPNTCGDPAPPTITQTVYSTSASCSSTYTLPASPSCGTFNASSSENYLAELSDMLETSVIIDYVIVAAPGRGGSVDEEATEATYWLTSDESTAYYSALSYWFERGLGFAFAHGTVTWEIATYEYDPLLGRGSEIARISRAATDPWGLTYDIEPDAANNRQQRVENVRFTCFN